jgi:uncharacterized protein YecT (DUF1311 family)
MRGILLAAVVIQIGLAQPVRAETAPDSSRLISEVLPLFGKNHCEDLRDPAEQLFCGDPELNAASAKLASAIQDRMNRLADRRLAVEENAGWIRNRNSSCAIFGRQPVRIQNFPAVKSCLLLETEERIAILADPNFDCLANNSTAGLLICSEPSLATAEDELNSLVVALISKLKENEARDAFAEFARWTRSRDRKCDLIGKDNVPVAELSSSGACLGEYLDKKTAEVAAAKGDPRKVFGRSTVALLPNADAVDVCVGQIHSANSCDNFLRVSRVFQIDSKTDERNALVTAEVEMIVLSPFAVCSPVASNCTGTCWDLKSGKINASPGSRDSIPVAHRLRIGKAFAFQKSDSGWRCDTNALQPVDFGLALSGP